MRMPRSERILYTGVGYCLFVTWAYQSLLPDKLTTPHFLFGLSSQESGDPKIKQIDEIFTFGSRVVVGIGLRVSGLLFERGRERLRRTRRLVYSRWQGLQSGESLHDLLRRKGGGRE